MSKSSTSPKIRIFVLMFSSLYLGKYLSKSIHILGGGGGGGLEVKI